MIKVAIVGGTGYTGAELLRLLAQHPQAQVEIITSRAEAGKAVADMFPNLRGHYSLCFSEPELTSLLACDLVFFATPHGVAQNMMPELIAGGARVVDLSADFRIKDIATWELWYGQQHLCPELAQMAVYGLPEFQRAAIREAQLVACPGCYPTSIQLGLLPLLEKDVVDPQTLIANAASGVSGAGRQAKIDGLFAEAGESFKAYGAAGHRHLPEIEQGLRAFQPAGTGSAQITFVPHLLPTIRGIHATLYAKLRDVNLDQAAVQELYEARFRDELFVDVLPCGQYPQTKSVRATNICRISVAVPQNRDTVVIMSAIDNLTKGASGQAVQNMNIMFGFDEDMGLQAPAICP